jgi:predicted membrane metal-binding protein
MSDNHAQTADPAAHGIDDMAAMNPVAPPKRSAVIGWLVRDIAYIAMLLLALIGVGFRLPVSYWLVLFPLFGIISAYEGRVRGVPLVEQLKSVLGIAAIWIAMLFAIYLLYSSGVQGMIDNNASSLVMIILLALGTFCAGVQARIWQICAIGAILCLFVPGLGWLDQSFMFMITAALIILVVGGVAWWGSARFRTPTDPLRN